jgi:hypothetical protein
MVSRESTYPPPSGGGLYVLLEQLSAKGNCSNPKRPYLLGLDDQTGIMKVYRPDCGLWSCPQCALHNRHRWKHTIMFGIQAYQNAGENFSFATLTANRWRRGFSQTLEDWRRHWPVLHKRIRRYIGGDEFHYVMLPEQHLNGAIHMHVIWNAVFPGKKVRRKKDGSVYYRSKWLADNGAQTGLGWVHDNRPLDNAISAASYVTKYITKTLEVEAWPPYLRRVRTSNHWPKPPEYTPDNDMLWSTFLDRNMLIDELQYQLKRGYNLVGLA